MAGFSQGRPGQGTGHQRRTLAGVQGAGHLPEVGGTQGEGLRPNNWRGHVLPEPRWACLREERQGAAETALDSL